MCRTSGRPAAARTPPQTAPGNQTPGRLSDDATFRDNWCALSRAKRDTVVCPRQMTNVLAVTGPGQLGALRVRLVKGLIRQKQLPDAFLLGHLMAVRDETGIYASSEFHCSRCLTQRHQDGSMTYMHNVLETKVITCNGPVFKAIVDARQQFICCFKPGSIPTRSLRQTGFMLC